MPSKVWRIGAEDANKCKKHGEIGTKDIKMLQKQRKVGAEGIKTLDKIKKLALKESQDTQLQLPQNRQSRGEQPLTRAEFQIKTDFVSYRGRTR